VANLRFVMLQITWCHAIVRRCTLFLRFKVGFKYKSDSNTN